jgi:hypothetical protein
MIFLQPSQRGQLFSSSGVTSNFPTGFQLKVGVYPPYFARRAML